eukprot:CAMPEP_0169415576 /NCGR_PEP_ID=MMETSP1017-20121227/62638_1 /TAXON_ID=342587 /ORGANISM="Karlodinium micrum, Strain CCMP2283" /LENGTH=66 /DNA_ID=CAMNT_0009523417 /DNA_START=197 /DNA_END=397 /DNA_ORIENTATION=+
MACLGACEAKTIADSLKRKRANDINTEHPISHVRFRDLRYMCNPNNTLARGFPVSPEASENYIHYE